LWTASLRDRIHHSVIAYSRGATGQVIEATMRIILVALMVALMAVPAHAQRGRGKQGSGAANSQSPDTKKKKATEEEKAAKSALDRLPDKPYDPWHSIKK
jgi:hypothetical protein